MQRFFNTAGPCEPARHFMLPPLARLEGIHTFVDRGYYFVVHAPRQTGKTTALLALARELTASGRYAALLVSCEVGSLTLRNFTRDEVSSLLAQHTDETGQVFTPGAVSAVYDSSRGQPSPGW